MNCLSGREAFTQRCCKAIENHPVLSTVVSTATTIALGVITFAHLSFNEVRSVAGVIGVMVLVAQNFNHIKRSCVNYFHWARHGRGDMSIETFREEALKVSCIAKPKSLSECISALNNLSRAYNRLAATPTVLAEARFILKNRYTMFRDAATAFEKAVRRIDAQIHHRFLAIQAAAVQPSSSSSSPHSPLDPADQIDEELMIYCSQHNLEVRTTVEDGNCLFASCLDDHDSRTAEQLRAGFYDYLKENSAESKTEFMNFTLAEMIEFAEGNQDARERIRAKIPESFRTRYDAYAVNSEDASIQEWLQQDTTFNEYIDTMRDSKHYPASFEIVPLAAHLQVPVRLVMRRSPIQEFNEDPNKTAIIIVYDDVRKHFQRLKPITTSEASSSGL